MLHHNTTLTTLDLSWNNIGVEGATALGVALHHNTTLTTLNLKYNNIGAEGATALGVALHHNTTLTTLNLNNNNIGAEGATALGVALHHNTTLTTLDLDYNDITGALQRNQDIFSKMFWTPYLHQHFPLSCRNIVLTTLLNNDTTRTCSAQHVWLYIFSFWQRGIFHE